MRYRRSNVRYAVVVRSIPSWPLEEFWPGDRLRPLTQSSWRPDTDLIETKATFEVIVNLAGVGEDDFEVQLFDNALIVDGNRTLPACPDGALYHLASIPQGPFRVEIALPGAFDSDRVEARFERGLLRITLPKPGASR